MIQLLLTLSLMSSATPAHAMQRGPELKVSVTDVTAEYADQLAKEETANPTPTPSAPPAGNVVTGILHTLTPPPGGIDLNALITLGQKIWDFIINNKPTATYAILKSSIVPQGITSWTQLTGWQRPVSKVYRVGFKNIFGGDAGSFDYRISFVAGGSYNGKGKFLGEILFVPMNIKLHTDRSLNVHAELSEPLNYGTETDPVAAAQLLITWTSPTTTRFQMNSAEYFIYGSGEIDDLTSGN